jgi:hypothetical protein
VGGWALVTSRKLHIAVRNGSMLLKDSLKDLESRNWLLCSIGTEGAAFACHRGQVLQYRVWYSCTLIGCS